MRPKAGDTECLTLTVPEAAERLGISRQTAYELASTGRLPVLRLGRRLVIPKAAFEAMLNSVTIGNGSSASEGA
jgi:excisionase family DNA binding protein